MKLSQAPEQKAVPADTAPVWVKSLTVAYDRKPVLWEIDFHVEAGHLVGIVGPNGAGKSTLLNAILGLTPRSSGEIRLFGQTFRRARHRVGYMPQRESVDWDFPVTVVEVVMMGMYRRIGWFRPVTRRYRMLALEALDRVGMAELANRQIKQLSGGQQQRTFLARALVQDADLYLMDEPFAGVDAATEESVIRILREMRASGKTMLIVHHDLQTVMDYFDDVLLINLRQV
ncbi:MAG TPA: ABC transporter ATP-binding protein, partial [Pirellulaceae bacterium]|nr:ABC transporter ATP-binding protein [Pirellulaceae bacterium]